MISNLKQNKAEVEGFEPPEPLPVQRFSRPPHSATLAHLLADIQPAFQKKTAGIQRLSISIKYSLIRPQSKPRVCCASCQIALVSSKNQTRQKFNYFRNS